MCRETESAPQSIILDIRDTYLATKDVVAFIGSRVPEYRSSKIVPSQPKDNICFMVDAKFLEEWKDVLSDDLGVWSPNGTKNAILRQNISR